MRSFITNNDIPVGYETPSFPSLYWPVGHKTSLHVIYDIGDIWKFTLYWSLIFNFGLYAIAGFWASLSHRKQAGGLWIMALYCAYGGVQGIAGGTISGFLIGNIYSSGLFFDVYVDSVLLCGCSNIIRFYSQFQWIRINNVIKIPQKEERKKRKN